MAADFITIASDCHLFPCHARYRCMGFEEDQNTEDYLVAGAGSVWAIHPFMIGTVASGMSLLGVSGLGFKAGWPTIWSRFSSRFQSGSVFISLVSSPTMWQRLPATSPCRITLPTV